MKTFALICEYNPLHNGHKYQIQSIKNAHPDAGIVAIMSGNYVQRGDLAIFPKQMRAKCAIKAGCDLVLELPFPYSYSSAEFFARAGVGIADRIGICDAISFGSESGDIAALSECADRLSSVEFLAETDLILKKNPDIGYMSARCRAYEKMFGGADIMSSPNNILALEYLKAIKTQRSKLIPHTVKREGDGYNDTDGAGKYVSATFLREQMKRGKKISGYVPEDCAEMYLKALTDTGYADIKCIERYVLGFFRLADPSKLSGLAEISDGLEYRFCNAAKKSRSIEEFFETASTKKYTHAKIRRAMLSCLLSVKQTDIKALPAYTNVLAANKTGTKMLKEIKKKTKMPVYTKIADYDRENKNISREIYLGARAYSLYSLAFETPLEADGFFTATPYVEK